jgi:hypothetical protein
VGTEAEASIVVVHMTCEGLRGCMRKKRMHKGQRKSTGAVLRHTRGRENARGTELAYIWCDGV